MSDYVVIFKKSAKKSLANLPKSIQLTIGRKIESLKQNPYQRGIVKIYTKEKNVFRIRVGRYRVIYQVQKEKLIVLVLKISHRSKAY